MARNTGKGFRRGAVSKRSQVKTRGGYAKRNSKTGRFMNGKADGTPFKGVTREQ